MATVFLQWITGIANNNSGSGWRASTPTIPIAFSNTNYICFVSDSAVDNSSTGCSALAYPSSMDKIVVQLYNVDTHSTGNQYEYALYTKVFMIGK